MIVVGAKGFAKEVLEVLHQLNRIDKLCFYDEISDKLPSKLFGKFHCIKSVGELKSYVKNKNDLEFTLGIGSPQLRKTLTSKFEKLGLKLVSTISPNAQIGHYDVVLKEGVNCMGGVIITNSILIGKGCLINLNCTIGHDTVIGQFVELSPGVHISGNCFVGNYVTIGTNATVLPKVKVGEGAIVGAGAVVTKDVPEYSLAVGIPAKVIKKL